MVQRHHLAGQYLSLLRQMRGRRLLEGTSRQYAQVNNLHWLPGLWITAAFNL